MPRPTLPTLIVGAWDPEIFWLRRWLGTKVGRAAGRGVDLETVGVGAVDAGVHTARLLAETRARRVVFLGTAGTYAADSKAAVPALDAAVVVARALLVSTAALRADGYLPPPLITEVAADPKLVRQLGKAHPGITHPSVTAACPLAITGTSALGRRIADVTAANVENLELFAVGRAAAQAGVPFAAVVGIANRVGPRAHSEWKAHHPAASQAAAECIRDWLLSL